MIKRLTICILVTVAMIIITGAIYPSIFLISRLGLGNHDLNQDIYTSYSTAAAFPEGVRGMSKLITSISVSLEEALPTDGKVIADLYINADGKVIATKIFGRKENQYYSIERKVIDKLKEYKWLPATCGQKKVTSVYHFVVQLCFF